jgi:hypothetical protein
MVGAYADDAEDAVAWRARLNEIRQIKDNAEALQKIAVIEKELEEAGTLTAKSRHGELLVLAKLPRLPMMGQGMAATKAIALFDEVLAKQPDNVGTLYLHARTCLGMPAMFGKREAGVRSFEHLVALADKKPGSVPHVDVFFYLAKVKPDRAAEIYRIGLKSFPDNKKLQAALQVKKPEPVSPEEQARLAKDAKKRFLDAMLANKPQYAALDRALAAGQKLHPKDHEYPLFRGLLRLWQGEITPSGQLASEGAELFRLALRVNPEDTRIYGWLGPVVYAIGHVTGQKEMIADGEKLMATGVEKNPEQNLFGRAFAYRITDTHPDRIQEDLYKTMDLSSGKKIDRARFLPEGTRADHPAFKNTKYAPHNLAGTMYWAGEFFRSRKDTVRARDAYVVALRSDKQENWPYRKLAIERLALLGGKAQKLTPNPVSCMLCHQR